MSIAIRTKTEDALQAFLKKKVQDDPDSPLAMEGFGIETAHTATEFALPCLVIECPRARELAADSGWFHVDVVVHVFTAMDEEHDNPDDEENPKRVGDIHPERIDALCVIFNQLIDEGTAALNAPAEGDDERTVKGFTAFGFFHDEEIGDQEDSHLFDQLKYGVHCMPYDG